MEKQQANNVRPRRSGAVPAAIFSAMAILAPLSLRAEENETKKAELSGDLDNTLFQTWGWVIAREKRVAGVEIDETELAAFVGGFLANIGNQRPPGDFRAIYPDVERLAKDRRQKVTRAIEQRNQARAEEFFRELKNKTNTVGLPSGARYEILNPGEGGFPNLEQTVTVHYVARLIDGTEFMQFGPIDLVLVSNHEVCRGWTDAMQRLRKGGAMRLYVPPPLPEAEAADRGIEPGSAMIFEIELLDIKDTAPDALASSLAPPPPDEPPPPSGLPDLKIIEAWGWSIAQQTGISALGLAGNERLMVAKGLAAGIRNQPAPVDLQDMEAALKAFVAQRKEHARQAERQKRREETSAFFAGLKASPDIVESPDGLYYEIIKRGDGTFPKPGQIVLVDYTGRLIDGTVFDRTDNEPLNVEVGSVIQGWNEGIQRIDRGGRIKLYIPPELGYKEISLSGHAAPIPPGSTLIYEIELLEIKDTLPGP